MRQRERFIEEVGAWAAERDDVRAALLLGSAARTETPADEWSDVDVALFVDDPGPYLADAGWLGALGEPLLTFVEPAAAGGALERRVLFEDGIEADFSLFPAQAAEGLLADAAALETVRRGYRVLADRSGIRELLTRVPHAGSEPPDAAALDVLAADVWYHALWAAKKLRRGEVWVARSCVECLIAARLVEAAALRARALDPSRDTWHGARFLERWGGETVASRLWDARAHGPDDVAAAIRRSVALFDELVDETARLVGVVVTVRRDEARERLETLLEDA